MWRPRLRGPVIGLGVVLLLTACASAEGRSETYGVVRTPDMSDLDGTTWVAERIEDPDREIVPGSRIVLSFQDDAMSARAGCNTLRGQAAIEDGELVVPVLASTMMACEEALMQQDDWLNGFLSSRPAIEVTDDDLWLSQDDTVLHFVRD